MQHSKLKESYDWQSVRFDAKDILLLLEKAVMAEVVVRHDNGCDWIGVSCEYDRESKVFCDQTFYIDDQEFASLEEFKARAVLGGRLFTETDGALDVIDTLEGDPAYYFELVSALREDTGKK